MDQWELVLLKAQQYIGMPVLDQPADDDKESNGDSTLDDDLLTEAECAVSGTGRQRQSARRVGRSSSMIGGQR